MTVYVGEVRDWARKHGKKSCHLLPGGRTQKDLDELHAMAARIGVKKWAFMPGEWIHYDLLDEQRLRAVSAGAIECSLADWVRLYRMAA